LSSQNISLLLKIVWKESSSWTLSLAKANRWALAAAPLIFFVVVVVAALQGKRPLEPTSLTIEVLVSMSEQRKAVIKNADMSDQMQQDAVDIASKALSEYNIEKVLCVVIMAVERFGVVTLLYTMKWTLLITDPSVSRSLTLSSF
jgi:hypothetical protein